MIVAHRGEEFSESDSSISDFKERSLGYPAEHVLRRLLLV